MFFASLDKFGSWFKASKLEHLELSENVSILLSRIKKNCLQKKLICLRFFFFLIKTVFPGIKRLCKDFEFIETVVL